MSRPLSTHYDLVVIGAGIVGLASAREFLHRYPKLRVLVVEKEQQIASHQTGHNSGVIHTGIYYAPGSLKARTCVEGHRRMIEYCAEKGIRVEKYGKVIVAINENELPRLDNLYQRGIANGVQGLEMIGAERLKEIEPHAAGIKAIWSPTTSVVNYKEVAAAYAEDIRAAGGEIVVECKLTAITQREDQITLGLYGSFAPHWEGEITTHYLITCGGLHSDLLANMASPERDMQIIPFRGDYYLLKPEKRSLVNGMIYPVPDPRFPFLGVHFTRLISGEVKAGPNAVLAFAREGYGRKDVDFKELREILTSTSFIRLAMKYWRMGALEMYRDYVKSAYVKALQQYMPEITGDDLLPGPSGVRAQALAKNGKLVDDFLIRQGKNMIHVQNAPSPAATASLVIGEHIVNEAQKNFALEAVAV
ncbi:MAG: L-2-hydroxyglutarate oxidase [Anaerolineae bacterium]|nr:L-2-hydroxyglutarate oxidase [Anaerolineae bacterium]